MSDVGAMDTQPQLTAGAMLRAARQAQGIHIAALATQLKVAPRKLEALEADQFADLQGPAFVRALAQAACRALRIDAAPVLARLPAVEHRTLDQVGGGLNAPYREHGARRDLLEWNRATQTVAMAVVVLLLGAVAMWFLPAMSTWRSAAQPDGAMPPAAASPASGVAPEQVPAPVLGQAPVTPMKPAAVSASAVASTPAPTPVPVSDGSAPVQVPARLLQIKAQSESWVDVVDAGGQSLISRTMQPGEVTELDGVLPLRVKIGNAAGTQLVFRGQPVELVSATRDNVARLELK